MAGNGFIDTRKIWGILSLDKKYPADAINESCRMAVSIDSCSYRTIVSLLKRGADGGEKGITHSARTSKFIRPIEEYKQLLKHEEAAL